jgi:hypothetical protein
MINSLMVFIVYLLAIGILVGLLLYVLDALGLPEPLQRIVRIAVVVVGGLVVVILLLSLVQGGVAGWKLPGL